MVTRVVRVNQLLLGAEVVVRVPGGHPGFLGDRPHGGGLVTLLAEQPQTRRGDRAAGLLTLTAPPPGLVGTRRPGRLSRRVGISRRVEIRQVELVDGAHVRWHGRYLTVTVSVRG